VGRFREIPPSLKHEIKVAGLESCRALFKARPRDITRVYVIERMQRDIGDILEWCERQDVPWYEVSIEELAEFTETMRHDGVCLVARKKQPMMASNLGAVLGRNRGPLGLVLLDGVKNPNNVGAVARTCAYFGVEYLLTAGESPGFSQAAVRVAQGATETVEHVPLRDVGRDLSAVTDHDVALVTTSSHGEARLGEVSLPPRVLFCMGGENAGVSGELVKRAKLHLTIPGVGKSESLNLAQATAILLWEHFRAHRPAAAKPAPQATSKRRR
jgi:TrmH RNA methyltransferase